MVEGAEHSLHEPFAPGICLGQGSDPCEGVGEIASSASGYGDLGQRPASRFEHDHLCVGTSPLQFDGAETSCCAGSCDSDSHTFGFAFSRANIQNYFRILRKISDYGSDRQETGLFDQVPHDGAVVRTVQQISRQETDAQAFRLDHHLHPGLPILHYCIIPPGWL
jgi:hypothetical protein